jgi:hypothetical protein
MLVYPVGHTNTSKVCMFPFIPLPRYPHTPAPVLNFQSKLGNNLTTRMIYASSPTRKHDAILKIIEMNLKEEAGLVAFQNVNNARGVSDAAVSPRQRKRGTVFVASPDEKEASNGRVSPRKSMAGRRTTSSTALASPGNQAASNSHTLPRSSMAGRRAASSTALGSQGRQAAPNCHASPRRSMAGRRAASSTALGRKGLFRQFSLRGWRESDSGHDGIPEEISEAKQSRLHDYKESPIGVCESPFN